MGWNQQNVDTLMRHIGTGMKPGSLLEVGLFLAGLVLLYLIYRLYDRRTTRLWLNSRSVRADRKFSENARLLGLLPSDQDLLLALASFLPEPEQQKHLLLSDPVLFDTARRDYLDEHPGHTERLLALRVKLNHPSKHSGRALHSTTEIPPGTLLFPGSDTFAGGAGEERPPRYRVREIRPDALLVECLQGRPSGGQRELLEIQRPDGHYTFNGHILDRDDETARLQHSYHLQRRQNRRFVRRDVSLEARLDRHPARIVNLSGGGARLHAGSRVLEDYAQDEIVVLRFVLDESPGSARPGIDARARIVEVDPEAGKMRLAFTRIRESDRDRIVKFVLASGEAPGDPGVTGPPSDSPLAPAS